VSILQLARLLGNRKLAVSALLTLMLALPTLEVLSLSLVYLMLSPESASGAFALVASKTGLPLPTSASGIRFVLLLLALSSILLLSLGRLIRIRLETSIKYRIYEQNLFSLMHSFLAIAGWAALKEDKDEVANAAVNQVGSISICALTLLGAISNLVSALILAASAFFYAPLLALLSAGLAVVSVLINRRNFRILQDIGTSKINAQKDLLHQVRQMLNGVQRIKFDMLEAAAIRNVQDVVRRSRVWRVSKSLTRERMSILTDSFGALSMAVIVFCGLVLFGVGSAAFVVLLLIFSRLRGYVSAVQIDLMELRENRPAVASAVALMRRLESPSRPVAESDGEAPVRIEARGVAFSYDEKPILEDVSFTVNAGDRILVQGPSGGGKSTLLKLITGFYPPTRGRLVAITRRGTAVPGFEGLRRHCFYCSDDLYLFDTSLRRALDYAGTASDESLRAALSKACLLELVESWPEGLDTPMGDDGRSLSLGQRERLLLARLFLREPRLVILDEATSNMDIETERRVLENVQAHLSRESILLVATHRESSAIAFNKLVSVCGGKAELLDLSSDSSQKTDD